METRVRGYFRRAWADEATKKALAQDLAAFIATDDRFAAMAEAAERFGLTLKAEDTWADIGRAAHANPLEERPSLLRLVEEAESYPYDVLVVYRIVDLSRACSQAADILSRLRAAGVRVLATQGEARWLDRLDGVEAVRAGLIEGHNAEIKRATQQRLREIMSENAKRRAAARG